MKRLLDWKALGQFVSVLMSLFAVVRDTFSSIGGECLATKRVRVVKPGAIIEISLEAKPRLPFDGAIVEKHVGEGWVRVEKRQDSLYVDGKKVVLYLSEKQQNGGATQGYKLCEEVSGKDILNANILDALLEYPEFIPEDWKKDANGNIVPISFWGTIYKDPVSFFGPCVRCLLWIDSRWYWDYRWLDDDWNGHNPAAARASA